MQIIQAKYMLDTNICIYLMKNQPKSVIDRFKACQIGEVVISAITWGELQRGLNLHQSKRQFDALQQVLTILPFDKHAAESFGQIMQQHKIKPNYDVLIAAHAKSLNLTLVTNNLVDFEKFGLTLDNWVAD